MPPALPCCLKLEPMLIVKVQGVEGTCSSLLLVTHTSINLFLRKLKHEYRLCRPIHFACLKGKKEIVEILIKSRCDCFVKDDLGNLPVDYALQYEPIMHYLRSLMEVCRHLGHTGLRKHWYFQCFAKCLIMLIPCFGRPKERFSCSSSCELERRKTLQGR